MGGRVVGSLVISVVIFLLGFGALYATDYLENTRASTPILQSDPQQVVRDYLKTVEQDRWEEAFNLYFHPSFRTEAVQLLPQISADRPLRKTFTGLATRIIAAEGNQALVRSSYTLDMVLSSNSNRIQRSVVQNFFVQYDEVNRKWEIVFIENVPLEELGL